MGGVGVDLETGDNESGVSTIASGSLVCCQIGAWFARGAISGRIGITGQTFYIEGLATGFAAWFVGDVEGVENVFYGVSLPSDRTVTGLGWVG